MYFYSTIRTVNGEPCVNFSKTNFERQEYFIYLLKTKITRKLKIVEKTFRMF